MNFAYLETARELIGKSDVEALRSLQKPSLFQIKGKDSSKAVLVSVLLHGCEPAGFRAFLKEINSFKDYNEVMEYIKRELSGIINKYAKPSYVKRFFYTQAGYYKGLTEYAAQRYLYTLTHNVVKGIAHG